MNVYHPELQIYICMYILAIIVLCAISNQGLYLLLLYIYVHAGEPVLNILQELASDFFGLKER